MKSISLAIRMFVFSSLVATSKANCLAESSAIENCGLISGVEDSGSIKYVPWGKKTVDVKSVQLVSDASVTVALESAKLTDLKSGMWIKFDEVIDGKCKKVSAGQFLTADGDRIVVFKGLPEEFILYNSEGWYTNEVLGAKFKVQPMGKGELPTNPGSNLRAASYREPAGGFVVYFPKTLENAVVNWGGSKPSANIPDKEGKVLINKDTCTDYYWKHLKNPAKPDEGFTSGLTEFTIRKLPKR